MTDGPFSPDPNRDDPTAGLPMVMATDLPLPGRRRGKVRDVYQATLPDGTDVVVIVAADRISAFDVVMPTPIPGKGVILTQVSRFWFDRITDRLPGVAHHLLSTDPADLPGLDDAQRWVLAGRVTIGLRAEVVPIECVVRGYLAGSGWKEYHQSGRVCGVELPAGLREGDRLPEPIFTPATKAETGHDENITFDQACDVVGGDVMRMLRDRSLAIYAMGHEHAAARGILLADTKFEFGRLLRPARGLAAGSLILVDEVLTPDSSRFWPAADYTPGRSQPSFDKQYVRDHLQSLVDTGQWDKSPPGPELPESIAAGTKARYLEAWRRLTGT